jgi:hypothetical protein
MEIKGVYQNRVTKEVYLVNQVNGNMVNVSVVLINKMGSMYKVQSDSVELPKSVISTFYHSGNYTREDINM